MKITALIPNSENACSMYRGSAVLDELHRIDSSVDINYPERMYIPDYENKPCVQKMGFSFMTAKGSDLIYALRPIAPVQMGYFAYAKRYNTPIVTDYDDNLMEIPKSNQLWAESINGGYKANLQYALINSNHVIVSTDALLGCFSRFNQNITVIRNAFDNYTYKLATKRTTNTTKTVLWRGSSTHIKDLGFYKFELIKLIVENPDINFVFWSDELPRWINDLDEECENITIKQQVHPFEYQMHLEALKPDLVIVPLIDNIFNRCKSDIAKLEAISVGAICIAPKWHEWAWDCTPDNFLYTDIDSFYTTTQLALNRIREPEQNEMLDAMFNKHHEYIKEHRLLSQANKKRLEVFKAFQSLHS